MKIVPNAIGVIALPTNKEVVMPAVPKPSQAKEAKPKRVRKPRAKTTTAKASAPAKARKAVPTFDGDVMTVEQASAALGVKAGRVRTLLKEGTLVAREQEGIKCGIMPKSVIAYAETRGQRKAIATQP